MTEEEFIAEYMARSRLGAHYRTPRGFQVPGCEERVARPCACGEPECDGWTMIPAGSADEHDLFYGPQ